MRIQTEMNLYEKLNILSDAAKYDVACTSSGVDRKGDGTGMGNCEKAGICHSFSADGRCISLLMQFAPSGGRKCVFQRPLCGAERPLVFS